MNMSIDLLFASTGDSWLNGYSDKVDLAARLRDETSSQIRIKTIRYMITIVSMNTTKFFYLCLLTVVLFSRHFTFDNSASLTDLKGFLISEIQEIQALLYLISISQSLISWPISRAKRYQGVTITMLPLLHCCLSLK